MEASSLRMEKMRLLVFPLLTLFVFFLFAIPRFLGIIESPTPTQPPSNKAALCEQVGGTYDSTYAECLNLTTEGRCRAIGGIWEECASPCRHSRGAKTCIMICERVCKL